MNRLLTKSLVLILILFLLACTVPTAYISVSAAPSVADENTEDEYAEDEEEIDEITVSNQSELLDAIEEAAEYGGYITLTKNITLTEGLIFPEGEAITLDLAGRKLDRGLRVCRESGSVINVEKNANLTITDSGDDKSGIIAGGASYKGGGIYNCGTLKIEGGTITGNRALDSVQGMGGGIYNASGAILTITGGEIKRNNARIGGGIYNASNATLNTENGTTVIKKQKVVTNPVVTANKASLYGGGILNAGVFNLKDKLRVNDNTGGDLHLTEGKKLTITGALKSGTLIGVNADGNDPVITSGYSKYNAAYPSSFFVALNGLKLQKTGANGEVCFKTGTKTTVEIFEKNTLTKKEEYNSVQDAWNKAKAYANSSNTVEITMGSNWEHDSELSTSNGQNITVDLNGCYIKRTRNSKQIKNGGVFRVASNSTLKIKDSSPKSKGYDGIKGGVITGGASTNSGGGVHVEENATFVMEGGTIYECVTCYDGGGIWANNASKVDLKNCRLYFCQTFDSADSAHGGGIYAKDVKDLELHDMTVQDCYSEDSGGGIYQSGWKDNKLIVGNVMFIGNKCRDDGGAMYLYEAGFVHIDKCTFTTNKAGTDGGAVYVDQFMQKNRRNTPLVFRDSTFKYNECGDEGSAIFVNKEDVVLVSDEITENKAGDSGAVYLSHYSGAYGYDISVRGRTIIRNNTAKDSTHQDLTFQNYGATNNYIYDAGLYEGAYISFSAHEGGKVPAIKNVTEYQLKFFHPESGKLTFNKEEDIDAPMATGSVFNGGAWIIIAAVAVLAIAVAVFVIVKKRKGGVTDDSEDYE